MADGTASLDISGDASKAQAAIDRLTRDMAKLREQNRLMNQESKAGAKESEAALSSWAAGLQKLKQQMDPWQRGLANLKDQMQGQKKSIGDLTRGTEDFGASLASMVPAVIGVGTAVSFASRTYAAWRQKTDELVLSHDDLAASMTKTLAESGKLAMAPQIERFLKTTKGITPQQGLAALGGVMASGETLTEERSMGVAGQIARLAPTGMDVGEAGKLAGDVADIVGPGTSNENVANLTVGLKQMLREKVGMFSGPKFQKQVARLKMGGMGGEDALVHAVAALQSEQGAEAIGLMTKGGKLSKDERKLKAEVFNPQTMAELRGQMTGFQTGNLAQQQLSALTTTPLTNVSVQQQLLGEAEGQLTLASGPSAERERARKYIATKAYERGTGSFLHAKLNETTFRANDLNFGGFSADEYYKKQGLPGGQAQYELEYAAKQGVITAEQAERFIRALEANTAATRANTPGPRVNIDGQNEARGGN